MIYCMQMFTSNETHTSMRVHVRTRTQACTHALITRARAYTVSRTQASVSHIRRLTRRRCMYVCMCVYIYACMYACMYVYIYIYICIYTHTHTSPWLKNGPSGSFASSSSGARRRTWRKLTGACACGSATVCEKGGGGERERIMGRATRQHRTDTNKHNTSHTVHGI